MVQTHFCWPETRRMKCGLKLLRKLVPMRTPTNNKPSVLHICRREMLRPLRDQILRISGFDVDSTLNHAEGLSMFWQRSYDLVLIDVEGEQGIPAAEHMCSEIKTAVPGQPLAF